MQQFQNDITSLFQELNKIGVALSAEKNHTQLLELILTKAMELTNSDGGTLYAVMDDGRLKFEIMHNKSLNIHKGGSSKEDITFYPIRLYHKNGKPNKSMVVAWSANSGEIINIPDIYKAKEYEFSGTRNFDKKMSYRSVSCLTVPMRDHENEIIGVLQLINAMDINENIIPFSILSQQLVESLASQAAVTITNKSLIRAQKKLFDSFIQLIANAIDEKSPYTAGHCNRVPVLTNMLAEAVNRFDKGPLKDFKMTEDEKYELQVAAWLHDCGKITTPEYVVDKSTKLETIIDGINLVDLRFEILKRDAIIDSYKEMLEDENNIKSENDFVLQNRLREICQEREDIRKCNIGSESISSRDLTRIDEISKRTWKNIDDETVNVLNREEVNNLKIARGTLSDKEREIINNHVSVTIKMLESLPYPKSLSRVPEYAGGHHEKMDGSGYPNKLTKEQMSIPARILAISDIFEALTAGDRPYKKAMKLSEALIILNNMRVNNYIDADLFDIFIQEKLYIDYAKKYLDIDQLDEIDFSKITSYKPLD